MRKSLNCDDANENEKAFCAAGEHKLGKNTISKTTIITISIVLIVVSVLVGLIVLPRIFQQENNNEIDEAVVLNSTEQANLSNWGLACKANNSVYYSDYDTGIYIDSLEGPKLFIEGKYSDLADYNNKLYCVEYTTEQANEYTYHEKIQLVSIDYFSKNKSVIYTLPATEDILAISNIVDQKLYFTVSEDALFCVDINNTVTDTGLRDVMKVTESGIYARKFSSAGLQLLSFDKNVIKGFDLLDAYEVYVLFENDNHLYIQYSSDGWCTSNYGKVNIDNGYYSVLGPHQVYGDVVGINIKDNLLYIVYRQGNSFALCATSLDGGSPIIIKKFEINGSIFHLISIVENKIYFVSPISGTEMFICEISTSVTKQQTDD